MLMADTLGFIFPFFLPPSMWWATSKMAEWPSSSPVLMFPCSPPALYWGSSTCPAEEQKQRHL